MIVRIPDLGDIRLQSLPEREFWNDAFIETVPNFGKHKHYLLNQNGFKRYGSVKSITFNTRETSELTGDIFYISPENELRPTTSVDILNSLLDGYRIVKQIAREG